MKWVFSKELKYLQDKLNFKIKEKKDFLLKCEYNSERYKTELEKWRYKNMSTEKQKNEVSNAAQLIRQTAETTATALNIQYIQRDIQEIKQSIKETNDKAVSRVEFNEVVAVQEDHEKRTRSLEESRYKVVVLTGTITGFLSIAGSYIISLLTQH